MLELLKKLDKKDSIDINKEIKDLELDNNQILLISKYMVLNNKSLIREAYEMKNVDQNISVSEELLEALERIKSKEYIDGIEDISLVLLLNRGIAKAIENIKVDYSLSELISETYLYSFEFYDKYFENIDSKIVYDVFDVYITIMQIMLQNKKQKDLYYASMGITLYALIKKDLLKDKELKDIIRSRNISLDYYNYLDDLYKDYDIDLSLDFDLQAKELQEEYDIIYNSFILDYIDTNILIDYLEINGEKSKIKKNDKELERLLSVISEYEY